MPSGSSNQRLGEQGFNQVDAEPDPWFRPVWEDRGEDGAADAPPPRPHVPGLRRSRELDTAALLAPLAAAQDVLARLDARTETAPESLREGLIARLAFREAAGWLAHRQAWVHPLDLALRQAGLLGAGEHPNTAGARRATQDLAARLDADAVEQTALALARLLHALARGHDPLTDGEAAQAALGPLGPAPLDPARLGPWIAPWADRSAVREVGAGRLPPLLRAAQAAQDWMDAGVTTMPTPLQAMAVSASLLGRSGALRAVPLPVWSATPAIAVGTTDRLPKLRADAAHWRSPDPTLPWPAVFLTFVAEAATAGLRELDRLHAAAARGAHLIAGLDRRSRLASALDAVLHQPAVTPNGLAHALDVTPQAALRLLGTLTAAGIVRETTGRRSFRAFAV